MFYKHQGRRLRVVKTDDKRTAILRDCHNTAHAGHSAINAMVARITEQYWWKGVHDDAVKWVRNYVFYFMPRKVAYSN